MNENFKTLPFGSNQNGPLQVSQCAFIFSTLISLTLFYRYNFWLKKKKKISIQHTKKHTHKIKGVFW